MNDISFERQVLGAKGELLNPSDLSIRVLWFEQRDRYLKFLAGKSLENLKRVFNILDKNNNVDSLRLDLEAELPFAGDMFSRIMLGHNVSVGAEALLMSHGGISLRDGAVIGQKALLITVGHPLHPSQRHLHKMGPIDVGSGVLVGGSAVLVNSGKAEAITIGEKTIILPGTIITKDIPSYCIVGGTNKILLQGRSFFRPIDNFSAHGHLTLESRLTSEGLAHLDSQDVSTDLAKSLAFPLMPDAKIYRVKSIEPSDDLFIFFSNSSKEALRICLIPGPVTVEGDLPVLKERMTVNQGSYIHTDPGGALNFSPWDLLAPRVKVISKNGGVIEFDPEVWVGAGAKILADGRKIKIGRGSIIAAGAEITEDVPELSIVVTKGKVIKTISKKDIISRIPAEWTDPAIYYEAFVENSAVARRMSSEDRVAYILEHLPASSNCMRKSVSKCIQLKW
jgi:acetyltransferase-like isoleucine patch superfamily enzyme